MRSAARPDAHVTVSSPVHNCTPPSVKKNGKRPVAQPHWVSRTTDARYSTLHAPSTSGANAVGSTGPLCKVFVAPSSVSRAAAQCSCALSGPTSLVSPGVSLSQCVANSRVVRTVSMCELAVVGADWISVQQKSRRAGESASGSGVYCGR